MPAPILVLAGGAKAFAACKGLAAVCAPAAKASTAKMVLASFGTATKVSAAAATAHPLWPFTTRLVTLAAICMAAVNGTPPHGGKP